MHSAAPRMPVPGDVLLGRFRVESVLGEGGMGLVFGARALATGQAVAIKVLLPEASAQPDAIPRFINEARATTKLSSPHVVKIFEAGTIEDLGLPYIVMEHLQGMDLGALIEKRGRLPVHEAVDYIIQAADAVAEAHALGIVHRDLKPSNLFLSSGHDGARPFVKVLDFGVSKVLNQGSQSQALTAAGAFLGSPHYMPPEQLRSAKDVDTRADIWSLGVILYELLLAKLPFDSRAFGELFMSVLSSTPAPIRATRPDVPEGLEQIVDRCLRKARDERFPDLEALAQALAPFASPDGARAAQRVGRPPVSVQLQHMGAASPQTPPGSNPAFAPLSSQQQVAPAPRGPLGSSGSLPNLPPSSPALPAPSSPALPGFYAAGQAPQGGPRAPWEGGREPQQRGPSRTLVGIGIGAVVVGVVGVVLIVLAIRARGNTPKDLDPAPKPIPSASPSR